MHPILISGWVGHEQLLCTCNVLLMYLRGLQFYTFFGISIGITRRMIDIGKKITFYFLQNVWKCIVFFAFAFKVCKKCYYYLKNFFFEKYHYGYQKNAEFYADFKFIDAGFQKCSQQKLKAKNHEKMHKIENTQKSHSFLALAFFRGICLSRHQWIWNQHKILRFFDTHNDTFQEKIFLGHNSTFCIL
jgi:hypothetical protein